jgi:hypothetical protein
MLEEEPLINKLLQHSKLWIKTPMLNPFWSIFSLVLQGILIFNFRADVIALGLIKGVSALGMKKPIVLRMKGTNIDQAKEIISDSGFNLFITEDLEEAATKAVKMAEILRLAREAKLNVSLL